MSATSDRFSDSRLTALLGVILSVFTALDLVAAQTEAGFFSIANVVNSKANTIVSVDGKPLRPDGIKPVKVTGGLGFPVGAHRIEATNTDWKPVSMSIELTPLVSPIVIVYSLEIRSASGQVARELRLFSRANHPSPNGKTFGVIYAGSLPAVDVSLNGQPKSLKPLQELTLNNTASVAVAQNNQQVANFSPDIPGSYLVILFDAEASRLGATLAADIIFKAAGRR
jgi:hypothetical protein